MREKWASQVRDRQDSGHDIIDDSRDLSKHSWGGRSKGKAKTRRGPSRCSRLERLKKRHSWGSR